MTNPLQPAKELRNRETRLIIQAIEQPIGMKPIMLLRISTWSTEASSTPTTPHSWS